METNMRVLVTQDYHVHFTIGNEHFDKGVPKGVKGRISNEPTKCKNGIPYYYIAFDYEFLHYGFGGWFPETVLQEV